MADVLKMLAEQNIKFVDLRFTDTIGKELHVTVPAHKVDESFLQEGKMFDGSSIPGWKSIHASDMVLMPDQRTAVMDPFYQEPTLLLRCDILEPETMTGYERDPRNIAHRAEQYLIETKIADVAYFGPEPEFFIFDSVLWDLTINRASYSVDAKEGIWNSGTAYENGNFGHRSALKSAYFQIPPTDTAQNLRTAMALVMEKLGLEVEAHHPEVATGNQNEISTRFRTMRRKGDEIQLLKYAIHNVAHAYGKTATFMPKLLVGDNGNGMHCHQSLEKDGVNLFTGNSYAGLSELALYYIGGILKHARAINAFANATTNSYRRLMPGFEAPVSLAYSSSNRSAAIRIPHCVNPKGRRIEVRFPDACCNPYLAFSAMLMAGIDGIQNKIEPGEAVDKDLYDLSAEEASRIPTICTTLEEALDALNQDRDFLNKGGVFTDDLIDAYITLKRQEAKRVRMHINPMELELYYSL